MRDAVQSRWSPLRFAEVAAAMSEDTVLGRALPAVTDEQMEQRLSVVPTYTVVLLRATDAFVRPDVDPIIWEHGRLNMRLMDAGILAVVMPVADDSDIAGIQVFAVGLDQARAVMASDPGVAAGIFDYDIHPVRCFFGAVPRD
jgi:hypothetical protein